MNDVANPSGSPIGMVLWLTGLSGSGKSTLALGLERELFDCGLHAFTLDGDNLRRGLTSDLDFTASGRSENVRRAAHVARLLAEAGVIVIATFISPYQQDRFSARHIVVHAGNPSIPFLEVYVSTPLVVCESRDPKGLYARARTGELLDFTGVSAPFEPPVTPDLTIDTSEVSICDGVQILRGGVFSRLQTAAHPQAVLPHWLSRDPLLPSSNNSSHLHNRG